ncbi:hypothetical protein M0812_08935 [Anaeramoeba flamelloides]|uniref:Uncharacterized protein n=1 Tax=Anaeramoeba flamelloides TaxID=1746091 RepID=A0AAV7ZPQ2_9EUKA|nr:hypothetical protein M0812_08935 [Anaeramoeba flamelloides]
MNNNFQIIINATQNSRIRYDLKSKNQKQINIKGLGTFNFTQEGSLILIFLKKNKTNQKTEKISFIHQSKDSDFKYIQKEIEWIKQENNFPNSKNIPTNKTNGNQDKNNNKNKNSSDTIEYSLSIYHNAIISKKKEEESLVKKIKEEFDKKQAGEIKVELKVLKSKFLFLTLEGDRIDMSQKNEKLIHLIEPVYKINQGIMYLNTVFNHNQSEIKRNTKPILQFNEMRWTFKTNKLNSDAKKIYDLLKLNENHLTQNIILKKLKGYKTSEVINFTKVNNLETISNIFFDLYNKEINNFNFTKKTQSLNIINYYFPIFYSLCDQDNYVNAWSNILNFKSENKIKKWFDNNTKINVIVNNITNLFQLKSNNKKKENNQNQNNNNNNNDNDNNININDNNININDNDNNNNNNNKNKNNNNNNINNHNNHNILNINKETSSMNKNNNTVSTNNNEEIFKIERLEIVKINVKENNQQGNAHSIYKSFLINSNVSFSNLRIEPLKTIQYLQNYDDLSKGQIKEVAIRDFEKMIGSNFKYTIGTILNYNNLSNEIRKQLKNNTQNSHFLKEFKKLLYYQENKKLVVCNMGNKLGHGVFAKEDIEVGTLLSMYSGELKPYKRNSDIDYNLTVDLQKGNNESDDHYEITSSRHGCISRFYQHLPNSYENDLNNMIEFLKVNKNDTINIKKKLNLFRNILFAYGITSIIEQNLLLHSISIAMNSNNHSFLTNILKKIITSSGNYQDCDNVHYYYYNNLKFQQTKLSNPNRNKNKKGKYSRDGISIEHLKKEMVATSNIIHANIIYNNKPYIIFMSKKKILKNEIIGFSYGLGYWLKKKMLPELFFRNGNVIPKKLYNYKQLIFKIKNNVIDNNNSLPQRMCMLLDIESFKFFCKKKTPVLFSKDGKPKSVFKLKKMMVKYNILPAYHGNLRLCRRKYKTNEFKYFTERNRMIVFTLQFYFPKDIEFEIYFSSPFKIENNYSIIRKKIFLSQNPDPNYDINILLKFKSKNRLQQLTNLLGTHIPSFCTKFRVVNEIVIYQIIKNVKPLALFLNMLMQNKQKIKKFFNTNLNQDQIDPENDLIMIDSNDNQIDKI